MVPWNGHQGGTVCRFVAMFDKHTALRKVEWNGNLRPKISKLHKTKSWKFKHTQKKYDWVNIQKGGINPKIVALP